MPFVLALDQGTTSSRALVFDGGGAVTGMAQQELRQIYPQPGWVEHDPTEIWATQSDAMHEALAVAGITGRDVAAIGITNQRETTLLWERATGRPLANAVVWQDRRTASMCDALRAAGHAPTFTAKTGLVLDPYFSGTKLKWLLDNVPGARTRATRGELAFGTVDTWLVWKLTNGAVHVTDASNASRTLLYDIHTGTWDDELLALLDIPRQDLPRDVEEREKLVVPCPGMDVVEQRSARIRGVGHVYGPIRELPDEPRVDRAKRELASRGSCARARHVVEQPLQLRAGEIGIEDEAGLRSKRRRVAGRAQRVAHRRGAAVLPDDRVRKGTPRRAFPEQRRLALVRDADGRDVAAGDARHRQRLVHGVRLRRPDLRRIVLDPAGLGIDLPELLLGHAGHGPAAVEDERARAGRTLVEGEDERHGRDGSCRTAAGEPRTPLRYHRPPWSPARKISSKASTPNRPPPCRTARGHSSSSRARVRGRRAS